MTTTTRVGFLKQCVAGILCGALIHSAAFASNGNTFTKVRYNGGAIPSKVDPKDWDNRLTVSPDAIVLELKGEKKQFERFTIDPKSVTSLSYGQEAHRRVGTMIALAVIVAPVALFGLIHKTRLHYIGLQYTTPDGKTGGILLQGDKDNYRAMLVALQGVANVPVSVAEKERSFVPVGVSTSKPAPTPAAATASARPRSSSDTLRNDDIVQMVRKGSSPSDVIQQIRSSRPAYELYPENIQGLKRDGVPSEVIDAMVARNRGE